MVPATKAPPTTINFSGLGSPGNPPPDVQGTYCNMDNPATPDPVASLANDPLTTSAVFWRDGGSAYVTSQMNGMGSMCDAQLAGTLAVEINDFESVQWPSAVSTDISTLDTDLTTMTRGAGRRQYRPVLSDTAD